eukprot:CCRYP_011081-RA/>CCRYP_011081-RA protein AED:0.06 eAED:0.06 QI:0/0.33/0.25/1/0.66/0.5/4/273/694
MNATNVSNGDCGLLESKCDDSTIEMADLALSQEEIDDPVPVLRESPGSSSQVACCSSNDDGAQSGDSVIVGGDESMPCRVLDDTNACSDVGDKASAEKDSVFHQPLSSFLCPICLSENQVYHAQHATNQSQSGMMSPKERDVDALIESGDCEVVLAVTNEENEKSAISHGDGVAESQCGGDGSIAHASTQNGYENQHGIPIFELSSCGHKFCAPCIYAYIRSKLMEGTIQIPCCHFVIPNEDPEDFHCCEVHIQESDILRLIDLDASTNVSRFGTWFFTSNDHCSGIHKSSMKEKYQKIKFDSLHGKDSVRRCPTCDDPRLFDVNCMKAFESKLRAQNESVSLTLSSATSKNNVDDRTVFGRLLAVLRRRRQRMPPTREESSSHESYSETRERTDSGDPGSAGLVADSGYDTLDVTESKTNKIDSLSLSTKPIVLCQSCSTEFCYFHSNAHPGETCENYNKKSLELDRVNVEYANRSLHSKQCPSCGILVSKEGGCNQIKCGNCGVHFCWLCRTIVDDGAFPEHFRWWNLNGCPNMQLDGSEEPLQCTIFLAKLLSILQLIVLGIPSLVLAIASSLVCPCLLPGIGRTHRERAVNCISFWGSFLSTLIVFPLSCIGMLVMAAVYCFMAMIVLFMKCCTALMKRIRQTSATPETYNVPDVSLTDRNSNAHIAPDTSSENFLMELERIFERMEEGA